MTEASIFKEFASAHPVISILSKRSEALKGLQSGYLSLTSSVDKVNFIAENDTFNALAQDIFSAGPFSLRRSDLMSIWAYRNKEFNFEPLQQYAFTRMLLIGYAIQDTTKPAWRQYYQDHITGKGLAEDLRSDPQLPLVQARLSQVQQTSLELTSGPKDILENLQENLNNALFLIQNEVTPEV